MSQTETNSSETLDPTDWDAVRALGRRMVDDMMTYLETVRDRPVWKPIPPEVREALDVPPPMEPEGAERVYENFVDNVMPYPYGNIHPRFWGWVNGQGTPLGVLADMLAATLNQNVAFGESSAVLVETQVIKWLVELLGFPADASGILVSGGSMANLLGVGVALDNKARFDVATEGVAAAPQRMVLYASEQIHNSVDKAVRLLGLGTSALRKIPVDARFGIDVRALREAIAADRAARLHPFCVAGNAGSVNTGAIDDLHALADLCEREDMWLHVDGAFGAFAKLAQESQHLVAGLERADSLGFDLHKWMFMPIEVAAVLVRDEAAHRRAFSMDAKYLVALSGGLTRSGTAFRDYGLQLTRGFRALKVWMSLKEQGVAKYGRIIQQNIDQALYLGRLIEQSPHLELLAPVTLNVVCFRFSAPELDPDRLDVLNERILVQLQEGGVATPSHTWLDGRFTIRVAHTNHRSRTEDFDLLVREVQRLGHQLLREQLSVA